MFLPFVGLMTSSLMYCLIKYIMLIKIHCECIFNTNTICGLPNLTDKVVSESLVNYNNSGCIHEYETERSLPSTPGGRSHVR